MEHISTIWGIPQSMAERIPKILDGSILVSVAHPPSRTLFRGEFRRPVGVRLRVIDSPPRDAVWKFENELENSKTSATKPRCQNPMAVEPAPEEFLNFQKIRLPIPLLLWIFGRLWSHNDHIFQAVPPGLIRLWVGIEAPQDLIGELREIVDKLD
mgnify:CR=1 FL=1